MGGKHRAVEAPAEPPVSPSTPPIPFTAPRPTAHRAPARESRRPSRRASLRLALGVFAAAVITVASVALLTNDQSDDEPVMQASPAPVSAVDARAQLGSSFIALGLDSSTGVALVPVGSKEPWLFGNLTTPDAWSTIKIPLALAAERRNGANHTETKAIIDSDNKSARNLTRSLGTPAQAVDAVTAVLREGGDENTVVTPADDDGEWPHLGETAWSLPDSAIWTAHLPCMAGSEHVLDLMHHVAKTQDWGLMKLGDRDPAVKGGWGQSDTDHGYLVRQIGLLTLPDGKQVAVAMSTHEPKMKFERGVTTLNKVAHWLGQKAALLPAGTCPAPVPASSTPPPAPSQ
ncbi:MAG: hypothetical protein QM658_15715 [Gordonia sp. (in: high G+C Gram-positive bacteria)]